MLLITLYVWSVRYNGFFSWRTDHGCHTVVIADGAVLVRQQPCSLPQDGPSFVYEIRAPILDVAIPSDTVIPICLFIPIALIATMMVWRRSLRRPPPGFCRRCDYDLRGNTSGLCPECGEPIASGTEKVLKPRADRSIDPSVERVWSGDEAGFRRRGKRDIAQE
jgi:hypothetical protein